MSGINSEMLFNFNFYVTGEPVLKYKLMMKSHYETGIHYICITNRKNWKEYKGSGVRWRNLLKKHPSKILTDLLFTTDSKEVLSYAATYISVAYDIPNNPIFSNLVPELGYEGNQGNFGMWWEHASEEATNAVIRKRHQSLIKFYETDAGKQNAIDRGIRRSEWFKTDEGIAYLADQSKLMTEMYQTEAGQLRRQHMSEVMSELAKNPEFGRKISDALVNYWNNISDEDRSAFGDKISQGRHNMSAEAKSLRAQRVSESFKASTARQEFTLRLKEERKGSGNPAAIGVYWYGKIFQTKKEFCLFIKENNMNKYHTLLLINDPTNDDVYAITREMKKAILDDPMVCPHCNASTLFGNHISFIDAHMDNCKHKL